MNIPQDLFFRRRAKLPVILSTELAECGLACLAMVSVYHGHEVDLNSLRQRFSISLSGASLRGLMRLADNLGFSSRALRVEMSALQEVALPAVLHWNMNHYVVLESVTKSSATIHDPARGKLTLSLHEFSNHFTGVVLELSPAESFEAIREKAAFKVSDLFTRMQGHWTAIGYVLLLSAAFQLLSILLPFQLQLIIDKAISAGDLHILLVIAVSFGALTVLSSLIAVLRDWTLQLLGSQLVFQIAGNVFRHVIRLSASFFEKRHLGDILSRLSSIRQIQSTLTEGVLSALIDGTMAVFAGIALVMYSPLLAAIIIGSVVMYAAITMLTYPVLRRQTEKAITASATEQSYLMESIRGILPLKLMAGEAVRESSWRNLFGRSFNESVALTRMQQRLRFVETLLFGLQYIVVLYLASSAIIKGQGFTVGMLFAFLAFRAMFTDRVLILITRGLQFGMLALHLDRLSDFIVHKQEVAPGTEVDSRVEGNIVLKNVSFRYGSTDPLVLANVNLEIAPGDFIAITGRTGGGKTTLLKLLLGLQEPTEGMVTLNGEPAYPALWRSWRSEIGVVRQDDQLLSGTLAENIAFFDPDLDMQRVVQAAVTAKVNTDIERMPAKYLTLVGDMGSSLSGGQRQRILLARALYRSPKIIILDEGTANLDPATEQAIVDMLSAISITRIVVAHRPALVERAGRVIKVDDGKVEIVREAPPVHHFPEMSAAG